jgi:glycerol-3-phosphate dehydrogenase
LYDLIAFDRNCLNDLQKYLPRGRIISKDECLRLFPGVDKEGLTGGVIVHDCQMYSSERLILSFIRSAAETGADVANYVEVGGLAKEGAAVSAIKARDILTGDQFDIRAKVVVNTSGPWLDQVLDLLNGHRPSRKLVLSKAFNLLLKRQLISEYAVGIYAKTQFKDRDAILRKGYRAYFITPWRKHSLIGTVHLPHESDPDHLEITETEIQTFLDEINQAYPSANITRRDVCFVYRGLLPAAGDRRDGIQLVKNHRLYDHEKEDGVGGLISVTGVKFTEARYVAEKTVDLVFRKLGRTPPKSATAETRLYGGRIERFQPFLAQETERNRRFLHAEMIEQLIHNYGSAYPGVLKYLDGNPKCAKPCPDKSRVLQAEVLHAVEEEMAQKLADVIFRRTGVGFDGQAGDACLETCAAIMSQKLGWDTMKTEREIEEVRSILALRS